MKSLMAILLLAAQEDGVGGLIRDLGAESVEVREDAFRKLEEIGRRALPLLEKAVESADGEISSRARQLLFRIPLREMLGPDLLRADPGVVDRLCRGQWTETFLEIAADLPLPTEKRKYPRAAARDLSGLARLALREAKSRTDRTAVCDAAARLGLEAAWPEAVAMLGGEDEAERAAAARYFERVRPKPAAPKIVELAEDPRLEVRRRVASTLGALAVPEALPVLTRFLDDPDRNVRSIAAHGLGRLGNKSAVPALALKLADESSDVRWWTVHALVELRAAEKSADIGRLLSDPAPEVRRAAADAIASFSAAGK